MHIENIGRAVSGRDFSPVYDTGGTATDADKWYLVDGTTAIRNHQWGVAYADAAGIACRGTGNAIAGTTIAEIETRDYDIWAYLASSTSIGCKFRINGGGWVSECSSASSVYSWLKLGTSSLETGDLLEVTGGAVSQFTVLMDVALIPSGNAAPSYIPTGKEGIRNLVKYISDLRTDTTSMDVGDKIAFEYTAATARQVGTFTNIGSATKAEIPVASSATPDGKAYFYFVGYDTQGRMKLVPDRNVQHSISWDTINAAGLVNGVEVNIGGTKGIMRLMSGGVSASDTDNEWDKIIAGSTLGGTIIAGDNAVWNWNGIYTICSTRSTSTSTANVYRGSTSVNPVNGQSYIDTTATNYVNENAGFRPVFLVELPKNYYLFRKEDGSAHKYDGSAMVQVTSDWNALSDANKEIAFLAASQEVPSASILAGLGKYKPMIYSVDTSMETPAGSISAAPKDRAVIPKGLISMAGFEGIDSVSLSKTLSGTGAAVLAVTTDLITFKTFSGGAWVDVDITDIAAFKTGGITPTTLSSLVRENWDAITTGKQGIGFAYLPTVEAASDVASIAEIGMVVDMKGAWTRAVHGTDFTYAYPKNNLLRIQLLTSGDFKVNYHEAATT